MNLSLLVPIVSCLAAVIFWLCGTIISLAALVLLCCVTIAAIRAERLQKRLLHILMDASVRAECTLTALEQRVMSERPGMTCSANRRDGKNGDEDMCRSSSRNTEIVTIQPFRRQPSHALEPDDLLSHLITATACLYGKRLESIKFYSAWDMGLSCIKGNVRMENQDYAICFNIGDFQVMVVADGLGGLEFGKLASFLAVRAATTHIICELAPLSESEIPDIQELATSALESASRQIATEAEAMNIDNNGLRTTLIVLIACELSAGFSYIGDGGGAIVRNSGEIEHFLEPQKAYRNVMNILAASLGPVMDGHPVSGTINRHASDVIVIGTDGVFDRLEQSVDDFPKGTNRFLREVVQSITALGGDLQEVADQVLQQMAEAKDEHGFICDDNMVLGLLGTRTAPGPTECIPNSDMAEDRIESEDTSTGQSTPADSDEESTLQL